MPGGAPPGRGQPGGEAPGHPAYSAAGQPGGPPTDPPAVPLTPENVQLVLGAQTAVLVVASRGLPAEAISRKAVRFAKVIGMPHFSLDTAAHPSVAAALRITKDPTLLCVQQGQIVDIDAGGALDSVNAFFQRLAQAMGVELPSDVGDVHADAVAALELGTWVDAERGMQAVLAHVDAMAQHRADAYAGLAICALKTAGVEAAKEALQTGAKEYPERQDAPWPKRAKAMIDLASAADAGGGSSEARAVVEAAMQGNHAEAVELALAYVKAERQSPEAKDLARKVIAAVPSDSPVGPRARRRFANMCFN